MKERHYHILPKICTLLVLFATTCLWAAEDGKSTNIRFVNVPKIMQDSPQAKAARDRLQKEFSKQKEELDECNEDLDILDGKLRRQGRDLEERGRERMLDTIRQKRKECGEMNNELGEAYNERRNEELGKLEKLISGIIGKIAKDQGIELIVGPPIVYINEQADLTDTVLQELAKTK